MENLILNVYAFFKPILFIDIPIKVGGLEILELLDLLFIGFLYVAIIFKVARKKVIDLKALDLFVFIFTIWTICSLLLASEGSNVKALVQYALPVWMVFIVRNVLVDELEYFKLVNWMLLGYSIIVIANAIAVSAGYGVHEINYWSGEERYSGLFVNSHNLAHNMALFMMLMTFYLLIQHRDSLWWKRSKFIVVILMLLALYVLNETKVRTAFVGLGIFYMSILVYKNKKAAVATLLLVVMVVIANIDTIADKYLHDVKKVWSGEWGIEMLGSGRIRIWSENLDAFHSKGMEVLAFGIGPGNTKSMDFLGKAGHIVDSHNDFLMLITETGYIGFILYMFILGNIFMRIRGLTNEYKHVLMPMFLSVMAMNFASNSYISRFGIGQIFYMVIAVIFFASADRRQNVLKDTVKKSR